MKMTKTTIGGHFDGKVIVPDEPMSLPENTPLLIVVDEALVDNESDEPPPEKSIKAMFESGAMGSWAHRTDIKDSSEFARELGRNASRRGGE